MVSPAVNEILQKIDELPESDRTLLEEQLAQRAQAEWLFEVAKARDIARQQGIDQAAIDIAVENARYGSRRGAP